jgi:hypothetical protein
VRFLAALFSTPAASNPLTDLFSPNTAPEQPAAPAAPAKEECLPQPGRSTAAGQRWVYRYDGHRKCWFQAAGEPALAKKPALRRVARPSVAAAEEDKPASRKQEDVEDARAELLSAPPEQTPQPVPSAPAVKMVRTIPVREADAAAQVPPVPSGADQPTADRQNSDRPAPRPVDVEQLLADAPAASEAVASARAATPIAARTASTPGGEQGIPSWPGVLLMALGGAALFASSPALRRAVWPLRIPDSETELPATAHSGRSEPSFASARMRFAGAGPDEVLEIEPQSVAPLARAVPTRRTVAPEPPSREALWDEGIGALAALANSASHQR